LHGVSSSASEDAPNMPFSQSVNKVSFRLTQRRAFFELRSDFRIFFKYLIFRKFSRHFGEIHPSQCQLFDMIHMQKIYHPDILPPKEAKFGVVWQRFQHRKDAESVRKKESTPKIRFETEETPITSVSCP
jgi:hypothetical protein